MTLQELIDSYNAENYKFFKYADAEGNPIKTYFLFDTHKDYLIKYLDFYKKLDNLTEVIVYAVDGFFKLNQSGVEYFIRHSHQELFKDKNGNERGIPLDVAKEVKVNLIKRINDLKEVKKFDDLIDIVAESKVKRFGELSIYDSSLRIASSLQIEPDKVYLHAGARAGIEVLEQKGYVKSGLSKKKAITMEDLPQEFQGMKPLEIEHASCFLKDRMKELEPRKGMHLKLSKPISGPPQRNT